MRTGEMQNHGREFWRAMDEGGRGNPRGAVLMRVLMASARLLEVLADHDLQAAGLSVPRLHLLLLLYFAERHGNKKGVSPSALSQFQHISKNTVSSLLRSLEKEGLIERTLSDQDKRSFQIRLTRSGRRAVLSALPKRNVFIAGAFAALTVEEQRTLLKLLQKLRSALKSQVSGREFGSYKT